MKNQRLQFMFVAFIICEGVIALAFTTAHGAKRGAPATKARSDYCAAREKACLQNVENDCLPNGFGGRIEEIMALQACRKGGRTACARSWGSKSDCYTREKTLPPSALTPRVKTPTLPGKVAPEGAPVSRKPTRRLTVPTSPGSNTIK